MLEAPPRSASYITVLLPDGDSETRHSTVPNGTVSCSTVSDSVVRRTGGRSRPPVIPAAHTVTNTLVARVAALRRQPAAGAARPRLRARPTRIRRSSVVPGAKPDAGRRRHISGGSPNADRRATKIVAAAGTGIRREALQLRRRPGSQLKPLFMKGSGSLRREGREARSAVAGHHAEARGPALRRGRHPQRRQPVAHDVAGLRRRFVHWISTPVGYGAKRAPARRGYDIAHRRAQRWRLPDRHARAHLGRQAATITWEIDSATGDLSGRAPTAAATGAIRARCTVPSIEHLDGNLYVVSYRDANGQDGDALLGRESRRHAEGRLRRAVSGARSLRRRTTSPSASSPP